MNFKNKAFTLIELAIVMTIISLVVGSVFVGRDILKSASLGNVINEYGKYVNSFQQFNEKFKSIAGDTSVATSYWAVHGSNWTDSTGMSTVNGDGNGQIADQTNWASYRFEAHRAWQHLSFAGFTEGSYTGGFESSGTVAVTPGTRVPKTAYSRDLGWHVYYVGPKSSDSVFFDGNYGHIFYIGKAVYDVAASTKGGMYGDDITEIEAKFDDGSPASGKVRSGKNASIFGGTCVSTTVASTAAYSATTSETACIPIFITGF